MEFIPGPMELVIILIIVAMLFGVGRLPEVFGAVGRGLREFRQEMAPPSASSKVVAQPPVEKAIAEPAVVLDAATPPAINQHTDQAVTPEI